MAARAPPSGLGRGCKAGPGPAGGPRGSQVSLGALPPAGALRAPSPGAPPAHLSVRRGAGKASRGDDGPPNWVCWRGALSLSGADTWDVSGGQGEPRRKPGSSPPRADPGGPGPIPAAPPARDREPETVLEPA